MDGSIIIFIGTFVVTGCMYIYLQAKICTKARYNHAEHL